MRISSEQPSFCALRCDDGVWTTFLPTSRPSPSPSDMAADRIACRLPRARVLLRSGLTSNGNLETKSASQSIERGVFESYVQPESMASQNLSGRGAARDVSARLAGNLKSQDMTYDRDAGEASFSRTWILRSWSCELHEPKNQGTSTGKQTSGGTGGAIRLRVLPLLEQLLRFLQQFLHDPHTSA